VTHFLLFVLLFATKRLSLLRPRFLGLVFESSLKSTFQRPLPRLLLPVSSLSLFPRPSAVRHLLRRRKAEDRDPPRVCVCDPAGPSDNVTWRGHAAAAASRPPRRSACRSAGAASVRVCVTCQPKRRGGERVLQSKRREAARRKYKL
jgi:hypothetical protein